MKKISFYIFIILILFPVVSGIICKRSFTNISDFEEPFNDFKIGLIERDLAYNTKNYIDNDLENDSKYILKVTPIKNANLYFMCYTEPVRVLEVYKGDGLNIGDEIQILRRSSRVFWDLNNTKSVNVGFVNFMNKDEEYLVFLHDKIEDKDVYKTAECLITTIFSYNSHENIIIGKDENDENIATYKDVKYNEFFVSDTDALNVLNEAKKEMIIKYK